jgi:tetratricopeptide (TPR) repeat protein
MPQRDAYRTFLSTCDLLTWEKCLAAYDELLEEPAAAKAPAALAEALCVSIYTLWLRGLRGEEEKHRRIRANHRRLVAATRLCHHDSEQADARSALAIAAASNGYTATAASLLEECDVPLEVAVLIMPDASAKRAALLRPKLFTAGAPPFLPAVHFYAHALLDLGYLHEIGGLLERVEEHATNALIIDVKGKMFELRGAWQEAQATYDASDWAVHQYRRSICDIILSREGGSVREEAGPYRGTSGIGGSNSRPHALDQSILEGMSSFSGEIDQAEVARSASFVNACRWHNFDSWLISYELGKLSFRRRRYLEADGYLRAAADRAPLLFQFAVNYLRFVNFTWLSGKSLVRDVAATPEMLVCGHAALTVEGSEDLKAQIRTFIAGTTHDTSILRPVFDTDNYYEAAEAYAILGDTPKALDSWCRTLDDCYTPRAIFALVKFFFRCQFRHTANYLVGLVKQESWDSFVVLWELAETLRDLQDRTGAGLMDDALVAHMADISDRLEVLCQSDFQHLIRAIEFFCLATARTLRRRCCGERTSWGKTLRSSCSSPEQVGRFPEASRTHWASRTWYALSGRRAVACCGYRLPRSSPPMDKSSRPERYSRRRGFSRAIRGSNP